MVAKRKINESAPAVLEDTEVQAEESAPKKAPVKREDPIARAERLLEEAKAKAKEAAAKQLTNAEDALVLAEASLLKALKVHTERRGRVITLHERLGEAYQAPTDASQLLFGLTMGQINDALLHIAMREPFDAEPEDKGYTGIVDDEHPLVEIANGVSDINDRLKAGDVQGDFTLAAAKSA